MSLRREVRPARRVPWTQDAVLYRLWLILMSAFTTLLFGSLFCIAIGACGRGGAPPPCVPQPALHGATNTGPSGGGGPVCEARR